MQTQSKQLDLHKTLLYVILALFALAIAKSCQGENNAVTASQIATKKADSLSLEASKSIFDNELLKAKLSASEQNYLALENSIFKINNDLATIKRNTNQRISKSKTLTNSEMQGYFDYNYGVSTNSVVHLDSLVSQDVIVDLEVGHGAVKENVKLLEKTNLLNQSIDTLKSQKLNLEKQNENSLLAYVNEKNASEINKKNAADNFNQIKKEKRKKTLWKFATIPAFMLGVFLNK